VLVANRLGFVGLLILGGATALVCTMAELNEDSPTWGAHVFRARTEGGGSPERRAQLDAERQAFMSPRRFYRRCGFALAVIGAIGVAWQAWG